MKEERPLGSADVWAQSESEPSRNQIQICLPAHEQLFPRLRTDSSCNRGGIKINRYPHLKFGLSAAPDGAFGGDGDENRCRGAGPGYSVETSCLMLMQAPMFFWYVFIGSLDKGSNRYQEGRACFCHDTSAA